MHTLLLLIPLLICPLIMLTMALGAGVAARWRASRSGGSVRRERLSA
jgi:hypothetical protein